MTTRIVELRQGILKKNDELARELRARFTAAGVLVLNLVSSPGTGKTEFLQRTLKDLRARGARAAALVGDLETDNDARRLAASGVPVRQINTHGICHLEAEMIGRHLEGWQKQGTGNRDQGSENQGQGTRDKGSEKQGPGTRDQGSENKGKGTRDKGQEKQGPGDQGNKGTEPATRVLIEELDYLFIENVGNLVCPSSYDLGERVRVALLSVTEGEDKPLKYPTLFNSADAAVLTKMDIAEAVGFDRETALKNIRAIRPDIRIFETSAKTGAGMEEWLEFLREAASSLQLPAVGR
jgi:hydrogenase nickel incorporation protein HypB